MLSFQQLILVAISSFFFVGCDKMPQFPKEVKAEYIFDVTPSGKMFCYQADIKSLEPYLLAEPKVVPIENCAQIVGFKYEDRILVGNWLEDLQKYFARKKK